MIIVNLKSYPQQFTSDFSDDLGLIAEYIEDLGVSGKFMLSPNLINTVSVKQKYPELNVISQKVDQVRSGAGTGSISAENLLVGGISYSILNHSENRLITNSDSAKLMNLIEDLGDQLEEFGLIVCVENPAEAESLLEYENIKAIAYEPQELIGSGKPVTEFRPGEIQDFVELFEESDILPLVGAGVSSAEDVSAAIELGAKGVLLASAFVKSDDRLGFTKQLLDVIS